MRKVVQLAIVVGGADDEVEMMVMVVVIIREVVAVIQVDWTLRFHLIPPTFLFSSHF